MLEINNNEIKNEIDSLNCLINEYEEILLNLFNQLKDAGINWQDNNSIEYQNQIALEQRESFFVLQSIKNKKDILNYIYQKYIVIGNKIQCNLNNKDKIIFSLNTCIGQIIKILEEFDKINKTFPYIEENSIENIKNKIIKIKTNLENIKNLVLITYKKIEEIEKSIEIKISKLDEVKINDFDYTLIGG